MNDNWVQASVKRGPGSQIFSFREGIWNNILTIRYCIKQQTNCSLIVFEINKIASNRENSRSIVYCLVM